MLPVLIVGLGNPGPKYVGTRHNLGFRVIDEIVPSLSAQKRLQADVAELRHGGRKVILAKPRTFMNLSGGPVAALAHFFRVAPAQIIVIHDELEQDLGVVRARPGGGDHGHNGLKDITRALGTRDYIRLSCGIGRPPGRISPGDFVLKPFAKSELIDVALMAAEAAEQATNGELFELPATSFPQRPR